MGVRTHVPFQHRSSAYGGLGTVAVGLAGPTVGLALAGLNGHVFPTGDPLSRLSVGIGLYGLGLVTVAVGYLAATGRLGTLRPARPDARRLEFAVAATAGLVLAWLVVVGALTALGVPFAGNSLTSLAEDGLRVSLLLMAVLSLLVIAPAEELLFRGAVQASLYDVTSRPRAVLLASVPFALAHVPTLYADTAEAPAVALSLVGVFGLSLVFGWLHARTDDLLVPIAVHGVYNGVVFCLIYLAWF